MDVKDWIWFYYDKGFSIIPLGVNKKNDLKAPSINTWEKYHQQQASKEEIQTWIKEGLFKNIGVICGRVSNNLVVIDIDDESIPELIGIKIDKIIKSGSWAVKTGKGYHIYMQHHSNPGGVKRPLKYKIEYRANRGYVVAPPSMHPNGKQYKFIDTEKLEDLLPLETKDVKTIFNEMKDKIGKAWNIQKKEHKQGLSTNNNRPMQEYPKCVEIALNTITTHPMRYNTIYGIASSFYMNNIPRDMALKKIMQFNMEKCSPPHSQSKVEEAVWGAYKPESKRYGCEFWMDEAELCPYENISECQYGRKRVKKELAKEYKIFKYQERKKKDGEKYFVKSGVICPRLAELILTEYSFNFLTTNDNHQIYYYNGGYYHPNGESLIRQISEEFMEELTTKHFKNEVEDYIRDKNYCNRAETFVPTPELINTKNGVINIKTGKVTSCSPKYHFLNEIPVEYNPDADCPKIKQFFNEVVYEKDIPVIQEFFGYCLYRGYPFHKACMFLGDGKNGKSTTINLLIKFLGEHNVANKELQDIIYNRFAISALYGRLVNASADISDKALGRTGKFKELTGEDRVDAELKFKDSFCFVNYAKFLFSTNKLPKAEDDSYAFYRRWILISFPNTFTGEKCDPDLLKKLTNPDELSGLLNWALEGLKRLLKQGDFSYSKTVDEVMEQYKTMSDPEYAFVHEFLMTKAGGYILKSDLWELYVKWCKEKSLPVTPKNMLTGKLSKHMPEMRTGRKRIGGTRELIFENIAWNSEIDEENQYKNNGINKELDGWNNENDEKSEESGEIGKNQDEPWTANQQEETP